MGNVNSETTMNKNEYSNINDSHNNNKSKNTYFTKSEFSKVFQNPNNMINFIKNSEEHILLNALNKPRNLTLNNINVFCDAKIDKKLLSNEYL